MKKPVQKAKLLIVANPTSPDSELWPSLPYAEGEGKSLRDMFPSHNVQLLIGSDAKEATVKKLLSESDIIHFAAHAFVMASNPYLSSIVLSPNSDPARNDGFLTLYELRTIPLRSSLVTLNSCEAGKGPAFGDGIAGFANQILKAGAKNVLVSLWEVNDEVGKAAIKNLYKEMINNGKTPSQALRTAQLKIKEYYKSPELWGTFVMYSSQ